VFVAHDDRGDSAVVKLIPKLSGAKRELMFVDLDGIPNVIPILDHGESDGYWALAMTRAQKSLRDLLDESGGRIPLNSATSIMIDIAEALVAMADRVVHRDIKPENILLLDGQWCLADFGISRYAEAVTAPDTLKYSLSPPYAAPEQWRAERAFSASDVYAFGVVAYELLSGRAPFQGPELHDFRQQHLHAHPDAIPDAPLKLRSLVDECLYKNPQARPSPLSLLARLNRNQLVFSDAESRLQRANAVVVSRNAETARQESVAKSEAERRMELLGSATASLNQVIGSLDDRIRLNAPATQANDPVPRWSWSLSGAGMIVDPPESAEQPSERGAYQSPFEIVAYTSISLRVKPDRYGFEGRSHSLWYCDAELAGVFRWYETAFMISGFVPKRPRLNPFALTPGREAYIALSPVIAEIRVAWPFTPIDQGGEDDFSERWIGWFADAAEGLLQRPRRMPERNPNGTWRRT